MIRALSPPVAALMCFAWKCCLRIPSLMLFPSPDCSPRKMSWKPWSLRTGPPLIYVCSAPAEGRRRGNPWRPSTRPRSLPRSTWTSTMCSTRSRAWSSTCSGTSRPVPSNSWLNFYGSAQDRTAVPARLKMRRAWCRSPHQQPSLTHEAGRVWLKYGCALTRLSTKPWRALARLSGLRWICVFERRPEANPMLGSSRAMQIATRFSTKSSTPCWLRCTRISLLKLIP
mmetsp:Transcript_35042/g.91723  ORF Transcript_35042/g.91723 Transcript_35042/m.91723 type:complete len:227 (+) Transcript_35042:148-828(+)